MIRIHNVRLAIGEAEADLPGLVGSLLGVSVDAIESFRVVRRSLDARRERPPEFNYIVEMSFHDEPRVLSQAPPSVKYAVVETTQPSASFANRATNNLARRPVVVGCGPAGLFAALTLATQGVAPILLERGRIVEDRVRDIRTFWEAGVLDPESNVQFGEGGAGTFSDGKLTTRTKSDKVDRIKRTLVELGAPAEILVEAKPHIGSDRLRPVLIRLRERLLALGCEVAFQSRVTDILTDKGCIVGVVVNDRDEIRTDHLIWAAGQSDAANYELLVRRGIALVAKAFAMGVRIEHPQALINRMQYGKWWQEASLPPAEYSLTAMVEEMDRSVYTFCMCPGGYVIGSSSEAGGIVTNGMSDGQRDGAYANSAVVVTVRPEDFPVAHSLAGLEFRRAWEARAFAAAGGGYLAPAQNLVDFLAAKVSRALRPTTFRPGVTPARLDEVLPDFVARALRCGFDGFEKKMPGFITSDAVLIGIETRTSSPVRILREENGCSTSVAGFYPCGEGSGYAGGIISSAVDGIKAAESILKSSGS